MLFLLRPTEQGQADQRFHARDTALGFVIRASSEREAREFAMDQAGDEVPWLLCDGDAPADALYSSPKWGRYTYDPTWLRPDLVSCTEIGAEGEPGVVLRHFEPG